jgi:hypothetical protein
MRIDELKMRIDSFSELKKNWNEYDSEEITSQSIEFANSILDTISKTNDVNDIKVFPMCNGGIQIEIGDFREIEIFNNEITDIEYDSEYNIINEFKTTFKV